MRNRISVCIWKNQSLFKIYRMVWYGNIRRFLLSPIDIMFSFNRNTIASFKCWTSHIYCIGRTKNVSNENCMRKKMKRTVKELWHRNHSIYWYYYPNGRTWHHSHINEHWAVIWIHLPCKDSFFLSRNKPLFPTLLAIHFHFVLVLFFFFSRWKAHTPVLEKIYDYSI